METENIHVTRYLAELTQSASRLPTERRDELITQIRDHLHAALARPGADRSEAGVRSILERLGPPAEIVRAEYGQLPPQPVVSTRREFAAALLLTLGSFVVPAIGWLVGAALLWTSPWLRMREKLLVSLLVPGGAGGLVILGGTATSFCGTASTGPLGGPQVVVEDTCPQVDVTLQRLELGAGIVLAVVLPIVLYVVARRRADADALLRAGG